MSDYEPTATDSARVVLELDKLGVQEAIPGLFRINASVQQLAARLLLGRMTAYVLSEHLAADTVTETFDVPETWWQHLKHDLDAWVANHPHDLLSPLLHWWLYRKPIRYRTVTLTATWTRRASRPMSTIRVDDRLGPVIYQEQLSSSFDRAWFK